MDMQEFKKIWDAHDGWNRCMMIVFDNSARWILDWKNYHQVFREERDLEGNLVSSHLVPNSPKGFLKEDGTPDYMDLHDYLTINEELGTLEMKRYFIGTTPDAILDKQLHILSGDIESLLSASGTATPSTVLRAESVGLNKVLKVDVTLSSGSTYPTMTATGSIMTADDLIIRNYTGKHVEPGNIEDQSTREYSDTNVLRIAFVDGTDPSTSTVDGVYLSNYWNCGKYYQVSSEQDQIDDMKDLYGYELSGYTTDESTSATNYNYNNNNRLS
jgi:hypothetical protein